VALLTPKLSSQFQFGQIPDLFTRFRNLKKLIFYQQKFTTKINPLCVPAKSSVAVAASANTESVDCVNVCTQDEKAVDEVRRTTSGFNFLNSKKKRVENAPNMDNDEADDGRIPYGSNPFIQNIKPNLLISLHHQLFKCILDFNGSFAFIRANRNQETERNQVGIRAVAGHINGVGLEKPIVLI
jgi:hypothetical protein